MKKTIYILLALAAAIGFTASSFAQVNIVPGKNGGTGVANIGKTITLGGNLSFAEQFTTQGAFRIGLTATGITTLVLPQTGTLVTTADLSGFAGTTNITTVGTVTTGTWNGTAVGVQYGGTGSNLSATGGTSHVLKQSSSGAAVTVGQLAASDLSNGTIGTGSVVLSSQSPYKTYNVLGAVVTNDFTSSNWTVNGSAAATFTNSTIQLSGGTGSGNDYITYDNYVTMSECWYARITYVITTTINATSYGCGPGVRSINGTTGKFHAFGYAAADNGASHQGGLFMLLNNSAGTFTQVVTNTSNVTTPTVGDTIESCMVRFRNQYYFTARNRTDGSASGIMFTVDNYAVPGPTGSVLNNAGKFQICAMGGTQTITRLEFGLLEHTGAKLAIIGNSRAVGSYCGSYSNTIKQVLTTNPDDIVLLAGSSDRTVEMVRDTTEWGLLDFDYALIFAAYNDIASGVASGTWQTNLDKMYTYCINHSITPYFFIESSSDATSNAAAYTYVTTTYPNNYIDGYTPFNAEGNKMFMPYNAYDKIHWSALGVQKFKSLVIGTLGNIFVSKR